MSDRTVHLSTVLRFLGLCTTPELRQALADQLIEHGRDEFYGYGSKTDWMDLVAALLLEMDASVPPSSETGEP